MKNREIKFRAVYFNEWKIYDVVMGKFTEEEESHFYTNFKVSAIRVFSDDGTTWIPLQFTGLKDKNGKDIYEGDIICIEFNESKTFHIIRFDKCCFEAFPMKAYANTLRRFNDECTVVGNIYEDEHLLDKQ